MPGPQRRLFISRGLIALLFCGMGILHFVAPQPFLRVMPHGFPAPAALVAISGLFEILGGVGVLIPRVRRPAGAGLIALLVAVYPVNISMFLRQIHQQGIDATTIVLLIRLPLQFVMIRWVWLAAWRAGPRAGHEETNGESVP